MSVLLVTGGSRGFGAGVARSAAKRGWHVGISYTSNEENAQDVAASVHAQGVEA